MDEVAKLLRALLAVEARKLQLSPAADDLKLELVLSEAGLTAKDAAQILGKSEAAVAKAIQRGRKKG